MSQITRWFDRTFYPNHGDKWDDKEFRARVIKELKPEHEILDLGAGRGTRGELDFREHCQRVYGCDVDEAVKDNPFLHEARLQSAPEYLIPYEDSRFDVVYSNSVLEHVDNPQGFFSEVARVLKPGGLFMGKTPNMYHYMPVIARCTPEWFHEFYNKLRGRETEDTFPTVYLCNSEGAVNRIAAAQPNLSVDRVDIAEGRPEYLRISALTYPIGIAYERIVNCTDLLKRFRCVMYIYLRRDAESA